MLVILNQFLYAKKLGKYDDPTESKDEESKNEKVKLDDELDEDLPDAMPSLTRMKSIDPEYIMKQAEMMLLMKSEKETLENPEIPILINII